jgi:biotin-(acetyl-CoA carboxylase) ligase
VLADAPVADTGFDRLTIGLIRRRLASEAVGQHIYLFSRTASTMDVLGRLADAGARDGTVVVAEDGGALRVSVLLRPLEPLRALPALSAVVAGALADALRATDASRVARAECSTVGDRAGSAFLGIAVNFEAAAPSAPRQIDRNAFVAGFLNALDQLYAAYTRGGRAAALAR